MLESIVHPKKAIVIRDLPTPTNLTAYQKAEIKTPVYIPLHPVYNGSARYRVIFFMVLQCGFLCTHKKRSSHKIPHLFFICKKF